MNPLKMDAAGHAVPRPEGGHDSFVERVRKDSYAALVDAHETREQTARSMETFPGSQAPAKPQSIRVAIKVRGKILFIRLGEVTSVQAKGKWVWLQEDASSYLLRESICVGAEKVNTQR